MAKWFHITITVLLAILAVGKAILICGEHHWGYIPCADIAIVLFACFYGFLRLCFWAGAKIALSYIEAYQKHVRPRIEVEAIQKYIAEHPVEKPVQQSPIEEMAEHNQILNQEERLRRFMETCKREREQFIAIKEKADEEKLAKIQAYARQTLMPFDFTDEELFQVSECIVSLFTALSCPRFQSRLRRLARRNNSHSMTWQTSVGILPTSTTFQINRLLSLHSTPSHPGSGTPRLIL